MTTTQERAAGGALADLRDQPREVRQTLAALGRLLGASLIQPPHDLASFIEGHLGVAIADTAAVMSQLAGVDVPLVHVAVGRLIERVPDAVLTDDTGQYAPGFRLVAVDIDEHVLAPDDLAAFLPAGPAWTFDAVVVLTWIAGRQHIKVVVRTGDRAAAQATLTALLERARVQDNFYRGRTLRVDGDDHELTFTPIPASSAVRADLIHTTAVWREIDTNVGGLARHRDVLTANGLGASRGLLLVGPPGVGKTALCRVIAAELPSGTTVLLVDSATSARGLGRLYEAIPALEPVAVFLDDIDLMAGDRRGGTAGTMLGELLTHLDGFTGAGAVLTVATTNVSETIDPALLRPGRFDAVIEIATPDASARAHILRRHLAALGEFELDRLVALTDGASGADLREIVRRAVLERGTELTTDDLVDVTKTGRWRPTALTGHYL